MEKESGAERFSLEALRAGDRAEFARLVETYSNLVYRLGARMLGNAQDAEDVLQETFTKAFRALKDFDGRSSLSTWLYRIATNEALMALRRRRPEPISVEEPAGLAGEDGKPLQIVDWCCLPEEEMLSAEARAHLEQAIQALPASLKAAFLLRELEGLSTRQTAEVLGISEVAVKTRLSRARLRLREELTVYFGDRLGGQRHGAA